MSKLLVQIDYIKIAQWLKIIKHCENKIMDELDKAAKNVRSCQKHDCYVLMTGEDLGLCKNCVQNEASNEPNDDNYKTCLQKWGY